MFNKSHKKTKADYHVRLNEKLISMFTNKVLCGDALSILKTIPSESIGCVVTSPPYWALRDYGVKGQIGFKQNLTEYLEKLFLIFDEVKRVLKSNGTCFVVFGDTYASSSKSGLRNRQRNGQNLPHKEVNIPYKSLCKIPSRFAFGMIDRGWILGNEIIWHETNTNTMPEGVKDRFTRDFENVFFFTKSRKYYFRQKFEPLKRPDELRRRFRTPFDNHSYANRTGKPKKSLSAIKKSQKEFIKTGRNKRSVWRVTTGQTKSVHSAVFPEKLIETPIKVGCPKGGIVLDPFMRSGTTAAAAKKLGRNYIGIELNKEYAAFARKAVSKINRR